MKLSFAIPAHNEEALLPATIAAIHAAAAGLEYEIVVADDSSTDRTAEVGVAGGARVISVGVRQIARARNAAARAASGDVLIFVDADTIVNSASVQQAIALIKQGCIGGGATFRFDGVIPLYARVTMPLFNLSFRVFRLTGGAFLFCTREAFDAAGGWDETLFASEEIAMASALKQCGRFRIVRTPVLTSGRKLREFSAREILRSMVGVALTGGRSLRSRDALDIWYGPRARP